MSTSAAAAASALAGRVRVVGQLDDVVGADRGQRPQPIGVTSGADHPSRAEPLGDLDGHRSRVAGRAEHEDALPGLIGTRRRSATHDDIAGFIAAATLATSTSSGSSIARRASTTALSAIVPSTSSSATK